MVFRVAEVRVVGFIVLRPLQLSFIVVHTDLSCCCYMGAIIDVDESGCITGPPASPSSPDECTIIFGIDRIPYIL